jgi:hypothetical protein
MLMIMLRAAMYPCKLAFSQDACKLPDEDEDEWEEYQAYLRYMSDFLSYWGRHDEDAPSIHKDDNGTKSSSSSSEEERIEEGIPEMVTCEASSSWEGASLPPSKNPDFESACPNHSELHPLSPSAPPPATPTARLNPSYIKTEHIDDWNDECQPLSPGTPSMHSIGSIGSSSRASRATRLSGRLRTPDFLSPGTFRRWRRTDIEEELPTSDNNDIPLTPLMISPKEHGGTSYFSKALHMSTFISPLTKKVRSPDGDSVENPAKNKYF